MCLYDWFMTHGRKQRINLTVDPDIYRDAKRLFTALDMNMSQFVELNLAQFLQLTRPMIPVLEEIERGNQDPAELKTALRAFMANGHAAMGTGLQAFGQMTAEVAGFLGELEEATDKK
jgi:antitoxin component of RelBE/YafQ-DinJ toxin-antitoxin module